MTQPLSGYRVVDFSQWRTGAQASQTLADFGADVVWVEPPGGSRLRSERAFPFYCRGKSSQVIDLTTAEGRAAAADLVDGADIVIETFRPGVADRLGLGYEALKDRNSGLVYGSITGFGRRSPLAEVPAYEGVVAAKLGVFKAFERMTLADHPPFSAVPWCSFASSQILLHGILAALVERQRSGIGQRVETTMAQGFAALDTWEWFTDLVVQRFPEAYKSAPAWHDGAPLSPVVFMLLVGLTKDGHWLQFAQVAPRLFFALMKGLGLDYMFADEYWKGIPVFSDPQKAKELIDLMQKAVAEKSLAEWQELFEADPNLFAEVLRDGPDVLDHPQLQAAGQVASVADPEHGEVCQPARLMDFVGQEEPPLSGPPAIGQAASDAVRVPGGSPSSTAEAVEGSDLSDLPLSGVTVLEMAVQYAAPYGATVLTDLGARVIKVESLTGDMIRTMVSFPESGGAKVMQGKESICVDIATPEGAEIVRRIAARADLVLDGFRPGATARAGLGADDLRAINPRLVHVSASGYGPGGPCSDRPAFAPSIGAASGVARANLGDTVRAEPGQSLSEVRDGSIRLFAGAAIVQAQADGFAALGVATSLLLGLLSRDRTGSGQTISSSMLLTATHAMADQVVDYERAPERAKTPPDMRGLSALYRIYDAVDGWVFLAVTSDREWAKLVAALAAVPELADSRFVTEAGRAEADEDLIKILTDVFSTASPRDWERTLIPAGVACVEVTTDRVERKLQSDELCGPDSYTATVNHPTFDEHLRLAPLVRFSRSQTQAKPGVLAGSATDVILAELGFGEGAIADLRERSIVA